MTRKLALFSEPKIDPLAARRRGLDGLEQSLRALDDRALPHSSRALRQIMKARAALHAGNEREYERHRDLARLEASFARAQLRAPLVVKGIAHAERMRRLAPDGGKAKAEAYSRPELDDLIRAALTRDPDARLPRREWASTYGLSPATVGRRKKKIGKELKLPPRK